MRGVATATVFFFILLLIATHTESCEEGQMGNGCRISSGKCQCGYGCKSEFRYHNLEACNNVLNGRPQNACYRTRCLHGGSCLQITSDPKYRCLCEGTGYYGSICEKPCPGPGSNLSGPLECIVI